MLHDSGILTICGAKNKAANGDLCREKLKKLSRHYYGERTVGYGRQYAAKGVNEQVDLLAEIWEDRSIRIGMVAVTDNDEQYRIDLVQHKLDDETGLRVTWLTLRRLEECHEFDSEAEETA